MVKQNVLLEIPDTQTQFFGLPDRINESVTISGFLLEGLGGVGLTVKLKEDNAVKEELNNTRQVIEGIQVSAFKAMLKNLHNNLFKK